MVRERALLLSPRLDPSPFPSRYLLHPQRRLPAARLSNVGPLSQLLMTSVILNLYIYVGRRVGGASGSLGTVSNSPVVLSQVVPPPRQSRLAQSNSIAGGIGARPSPPVQSSRRGAPSRPLQTHSDDATGEDHDDADDPTDPEDKQLYCFCRKLSYGEVRKCIRSQTLLLTDIPLYDGGSWISPRSIYISL